ncbi:MAG: sulfatase-like hydrolase/transferase [Deltaproteobacteria bacterium]|nr:sulfatase-like hydrolase/transferase [Deltaproteobacteria bacterium]MBW2084527.1 sulfatase-like hydrolase/transferase [Deltaproteobacteria bacterium]
MRVLYIDIDTLRPDHLSCYGYPRETTPNIDRICAEAVRFDNCYASDAPCLPSRSACWTGRFGIHTGVVNHGGLAAGWTVMKEGGSFHANENSQAFKGYLNRLRQTGRSFYADWLAENKGKPIPDGAPWAAALEPDQELLTRPYSD